MLLRARHRTLGSTVSEPTASEIVALLGVDPSALPLATSADLAAAVRGAGPQECAACGSKAEVALVAKSALGNRWVDLCTRCFTRGRSMGGNRRR
jgi:hypothetical protein